MKTPSFKNLISLFSVACLSMSASAVLAQTTPVQLAKPSSTKLAKPLNKKPLKPAAQPKATPEILKLRSILEYQNRRTGPGSGGGGDPYTLDFINTADNEVIPWLEDHGHELPTPVDVKQFKSKINPRRVIVLPDVYESCDGTSNGRTVVGCYNAQEKIWMISRTLYPIDAVDSPMKRNFIMHEVFRALGVEGDDYEQTRTITRFQVLPEEFQDCTENLYNYMSGPEAARACEKNGADQNFQKCVGKMYSIMSAAEAVRLCERSGADEKVQACTKNLYSVLSSQEAAQACVRSGADEKYQACVKNMYRFMSGSEAVKACHAR